MSLPNFQRPVLAPSSGRSANPREKSPEIKGSKSYKASLIALMMEAVQASGTLVNTHQSTRRYIPEDSHLHTHRRENLKSYLTHLSTSQLRTIHVLSITMELCVRVCVRAYIVLTAKYFLKLV
jgi:hypothetical protein